MSNDNHNNNINTKDPPVLVNTSESIRSRIQALGLDKQQTAPIKVFNKSGSIRLSQTVHLSSSPNDDYGQSSSNNSIHPNTNSELPPPVPPRRKRTTNSSSIATTTTTSYSETEIRSSTQRSSINKRNTSPELRSNHEQLNGEKQETITIAAHENEPHQLPQHNDNSSNHSDHSDEDQSPRKHRHSIIFKRLSHSLIPSVLLSQQHRDKSHATTAAALQENEQQETLGNIDRESLSATITPFDTSSRRSIQMGHSMIENKLQEELSRRLGVVTRSSSLQAISSMDKGENDSSTRETMKINASQLPMMPADSRQSPPNTARFSSRNLSGAQPRLSITRTDTDAPQQHNENQKNGHRSRSSSERKRELSPTMGEFVPYIPKRVRRQSQLSSIMNSSLNRTENGTGVCSRDGFEKNEENLAAVVLQKYTRRWLGRRRFELLLKRQKHRTNCIFEILSTEKQYVHDLNVISEVYLEPMKLLASSNNKPLITREQVSVLFSDIEVIRRVNLTFLHSLEQRLANYQLSTSISDIFLEMAPFFKTYSGYCTNYDKSQQLLKELKKNNEMKNVLSTLDKSPKVSKGNLSSYLILPIQRIPRYKLLLQDLLKHTDADHSDYVRLDQAFTKVCSVADHLNNTMKSIDGTNDILKIQSQFTTNVKLVEAHRKFKKEGRFHDVLQGSESLVKTGEVSCIHLFNDILVCSTLMDNEEFKHRASIKLKSILLFDYVRSGSGLNTIFQIKSPDHSAIFQCFSVEEKQEWLQLIHETIMENRNTNRSNSLHITARSLQDSSNSTISVAKSRKSTDIELSVEDAISTMKKGSALLKYCTHRKPHFRTIALSDDGKYIRWGSRNKSLDKSQIGVDTINQIVQGQKTLVFEKRPNPELESLSFSILYGNKTLDLVCTDKREYQMWITGLNHLISGDFSSPSQSQTTTDELSLNRVSINMGKEKKNLKNNFEHLGDAYTWGQGLRGGLGHGIEQDLSTPMVMRDFLFLDIAFIACNNNSSAAITRSGELFTWGSGEKGKLGHGDSSDRLKPSLVRYLVGTSVSKVQMGFVHTMVLDTQGDIWVFGSSEYGQLGLGTKSSSSTSTPTKLKFNERVMDIACGNWHSACITESGSVYIWGRNEDGQLGTGNRENQSSPVNLSQLYNFKARQVSLGAWHSLILRLDCQVMAFGNGSYGQLGLGSNENKLSPQHISSLSNLNVVQVACGSGHSACLLADGSIYAWGSGLYGQIGIRNKSNCHFPQRIVTIGPSKQIACGANHTMCVTQQGTVLAWGSGMYGRLGLGDEVDQDEPKQVEFLYRRSVRMISAGGNQSSCICAHQWVPDKDAKACMQCNTNFTFKKRRHHCRYCGGLFCHSCSDKKIAILRFGFDQPVRVCDACYSILNESR